MKAGKAQQIMTGSTEMNVKILLIFCNHVVFGGALSLVLFSMLRSIFQEIPRITL